MEPIHVPKGFSLIELMVVLAIIGVLTVVALTSQSTFNKTFVLANATYDVALSIRSAEGFGVGSRAAGVSINTAYGIHFEGANTFILFADTFGGLSCVGATPDCKPGDYKYTPDPGNGQGDRVIQTFTLGNGITISKFCAQSNGPPSCWNVGGASAITKMDVTFERPYLATHITADAGSGYTAGACVTLKSPQGDTRSILVSPTTLISPTAPTC